MSSSKKFSGQLPLMQVNQQRPKDDHYQGTDPAPFRVNLHTFVDNQTRPAISPVVSPHTSNDPVTISTPTYKRITFTSANMPGQPVLENGSDSTQKPKRKKRRLNQNSTKTRLKSLKNSPSSTDMHADAWSIILSHTTPSFVMQMRTVSKFFYHITNVDAVWRDAREHHFGADMPPRPAFLTERQYASLLDGRGCQNPQCERRETRKVRWVFRLRLCDDCLSRKLEVFKLDTEPSPQSRYTALFPNIQDRDQYGTSIIDLLPTSGTWSNKPNAPRGVQSGKWERRASIASPLLYLKSDYAALQEEYKKVQEEDWEPQRVLEWVKEKYENAVLIAQSATDLEKWESERYRDSMNTGSVRVQRVDFFTHKARQMSPPMSEELLNCFAAYHTSLASSNPPSDRAWDTLFAKIVDHRDDANKVVNYLASRWGARFTQVTVTSPDAALFDRLHDRRRTKWKEASKWSPEQTFILELAEKEFDNLVDQVADEDLVLLCLRNVYNVYQDISPKPQGLDFEGKMGEYRLSLDDAKLIVEEIIEKRIKRSTLRGVKVLESLRCMGCTRFTSGKRYSFQAAFEHILDKHARYVGKDLHFHRYLKYSKVPPDGLAKDYRFPWYLAEWTKSLPLLPTHAPITSETRWIPNADLPYEQISKPNSVSAFEGKHAIPSGDSPTNDFTANFVHAAKTMSTTRLDSESVVKIAVTYMTELSESNSPSIDDFFKCVKPTEELGTGLQFKFRCGACNHRPDVNSHLRCVKHSVEINMLRKHWDDKHAHEKIDWATNLMDLPSDTELWEIMVAQDEKLQKDQASSIERETILLKKNAKKIPDQKAGALMQKEMAVDAFGRLFADNASN